MIEKAKLNYYDIEITGPISTKYLVRAYRFLCDRECSFQQLNISSESFNKYFTSFVADLDDKLETDGYNKPKIENVLITAIFSVVQKNLKIKSSIGHDGISKQILRISLPVISFFKADLIKHSISDWIFHGRLKVAKVIALYKTGAKSDPGNYRPISLMSSISKVFEIFFKKRMLFFN